ncbi:heparin lyase I family protein [Bacteroides thetaiotaomicron]|uniref:heparin lyase I family protein n=1 Tax=Bacteroides thetaiotaomicron TaxID=818 RepID=UPI000D97BFA9|nr:heparin lyase I family protein [Bacteroides thetaiotaomicron]MCS2189101.1 polysaccharide lyase [Bacteroides thetaiotaomicron]MCS2685343.1 polysaccharide lyase [Bacteroides thetaiotaomicron]MCS2848284.1 polysaccharide lyase [Bacteroides thetaiotaomicron]QQA07236.1 heparin lyase I family protein [Bacteroides thetaiotaomicron]SQA32377.1 heparin lyase I [Bacteroides thetaiotaomicron]
MKKYILVIYMMAAGCTMLTAQTKNTQTLMPLTERVNVQADSARINQIIDGCWVAVGTNKPHAIQRDFTNLFDGKPSYRFELKTEDNTLEGYAKGETKGRAEFSYCYATSDDFKGLPADVYQKAQITKTVYHHGKGACPQGSSRDYEFSVYIPSSLDSNVSTIFAQWHGMPDRTLVQTPQGEVKKLTVDEFVELEKTTFFKKNAGHEKVVRLDKQGNPMKDKNGKPVYKAGKLNGWLVEQGGYPPLAFGFSGGLFYIKANSDRKWLTDKDDRCNANPGKTPVMKPLTSEYKASTIAYKLPFADFPKDCWITFRVHIDWTVYGKEAETIVKPGMLDVRMDYQEQGKKVSKHIVNNEKILIGRNDEDGYYFKFGIYRVGDSTVPVCYNLAGYSER